MRQYYLRCSLILVCYLAVIFPCICLYPNIWSIMFCTALYLPVKLLIRIVANKTIACVLFTNLDAIEFQKLIQQKEFLPPLDYRINAAMFTGDYQTAVNIATSQIKKASSIRVKYLYLCILAQAYFELRDLEKLKKLLMEYDNYRVKHSSKSFLSPSYSVWSYYRYFLEHNYQACKILCKERNLGIRPNSWDAKLIRLKNDFFYAVACYENSEIEEAEQIFSDIIQKAPNLYLSILSKKYIASIQGEKICFEEILPDSNYQFVENKKFKIIRLIKNISLVIVVAALIVLEFIPGPKEISEYDKKLQTALSQQYTDFEVLDYTNVEENGVVKDVLVFVKNEIGKIDVGFIMTYDNGSSYSVKIMESNIVCGTYVLKSFTGDHSIELLISNQYYTGENNSYSTTVIKNSNKQYFVYAKCI